MQIFIDESGTFTTRADGSAVGAVGALVITESQIPLVERRYDQLRPLLPKEKGEVKGRSLDEADVARVVDLCRRAGLIYEVSIVDLPADSTTLVETQRAAQCEALTSKLTPEHDPGFVSWVHDLRKRLEQMPLQLYVQSQVTFDVIWRTLSHATAYYSQREPHSLASFEWVVDAKRATGITDWEDWWSKIIMPMTQSRSFQDPFPQLEDGDYSHLPAKEVLFSEYYRKQLPALGEATGLALGPLLKNINFSSRALPGLELVDVFTNAVRRALTGRLESRGWQGIASTMIHRREPTYIHAIGFGPERRVSDPAAAKVFLALGRGGRSMLTDKDGDT